MSNQDDRDTDLLDPLELRQQMAVGIAAAVELGKHYLAEEDLQQAATHFRAAAIFEHPEAMLFLAQMHLQGHGVEHNAEIAVEMLIDLAWKGITPATELLKNLWAEGICRDQIDVFHREVYERSWAAAEKGNDEAMVQAAVMLMTVLADGGQPKAEDIENARRLLMRAASLGNESAQMLLRQIPDSPN